MKDQLQNRELRILNLCYEQRIVTVQQLARFLYSGVCVRIRNKRLNRLERQELVRRTGVIEVGTLVQLTSRGQAFVEARTEICIPQIQKLDFATLVHDAAVTSVRLRLEEIWDGQWISEALLKSQEFSQIPDGVWVFPNGNRVAVEVENSPKGPTRFHALQERWRGVNVRLVLAVATGESMAGHVRKYLETGPGDLPFGLVQLGHLQEGRPKVWTRAGELDLLTRRSF